MRRPEKTAQSIRRRGGSCGFFGCDPRLPPRRPSHYRRCVGSGKHVITVTAVALAGCVGVDTHKDFAALQHDVAARTGVAVHWHDGSPADREADAKVIDLLARPLTADAAVQIALLNNRRLQAAYESLGVAQADLVAAGLLRNPVFDAAYRFGEAGTSARIDLGLTLNFLDLLFVNARRSVAAAGLDVAKAETTTAVLDLAVRTREAFYDCQAAEQAVDLRRQIAGATEASADLTRKLRDAGNITSLALASEQALHAEAELALEAATADAGAARETLSALLGVWGGQTAWTVDGRLPDPTAEELPVDGVERNAVAANAELHAARARVAAAMQTLGVSRPLGLLSDVELGINVERESGEWFTGPSVALPVPLFSQGQPAVARAAAELRRDRAELYATAVEVRSATRAAHARVASLRRQVDTAKQTVLPLRERVVQETQLQYNAMQVGAFQLLSAKRDQIESAAAYLRVLHDYWVAKSRLASILAGHVPATEAGSASDAAFGARPRAPAVE